VTLWPGEKRRVHPAAGRFPLTAFAPFSTRNLKPHRKFGEIKPTQAQTPGQIKAPLLIGF